MKTINIFFRNISEIKILGILPLDSLLHFIVGIVFIALLRKFKISLGKATIFLLVIALSKEFFDSFTLTSSIREAILDISATMIYPSLVYLIRFIKADTNDRSY